LNTEFTFTLPRGYIDPSGKIQRDGVIRLATAIDEVAALQDGRTTTNEGYVSIVLLSRVLVRLGDISPVPIAIVEKLFASDFAYLQDIYIGLNQQANSFFQTQCPGCGQRFGLNLNAEHGTLAAKVAQHA
jgi:hypothetical protein